MIRLALASAGASHFMPALLDAETRVGEILKGLPKASGGDRKSEDFKSGTDAHFDTETKEQAIKRIGFSRDQARRFEAIPQKNY